MASAPFTLMDVISLIVFALIFMLPIPSEIAVASFLNQ
ncbi:putative membrane protein [Escherichia coli P0302293.9]|nr:putative membrane protein [Escherichia coli P0302293.2]END98398.1 putative membrane protein [Escherichia coli P0302293.7]ENE21842.1 putative membrane protein [Escherichia coli P0302293.10]ENE21961.1 putative membrane protein [Escherichia coli P0302293.3]ENE29222.1 putative membrane protein [Escherichia coli P0302293.4]ENE35463.1 putative membrane protein [Escherichia coli P0302293.6]ENE51003.1 putative membrane protein [Escherichia coli P0302293.9]